MIAGGHTVTDEEPKYGLAVTGQVHPERIFTKSGAQPGDILVLTKPIGTGVITTAHKRDCVEPEHLEEAVASMCRLNGGAARLFQQFTIHACTDVTGYGLLGHAMEMARHGGVRFEFDAEAVPLLNGALAYAQDDVVPGGLDRNRAFLLDEGLLTLEADIPPALSALLFDPQTSGGLLAAVPPQDQAQLEAAFRAANEPLWIIGKVSEGNRHESYCGVAGELARSPIRSSVHTRLDLRLPTSLCRHLLARTGSSGILSPPHDQIGIHPSVRLLDAGVAGEPVLLEGALAAVVFAATGANMASALSF